MLFFVPAHDEATNANFSLVGALNAPGDVLLHGESATRDALQGAIATAEVKALFAMAHGKKNALLDNNRHDAIQRGDAASLSGFQVFAWACHTGAGLGHHVAQAGATWWGYDCAVTAPDDRAVYSSIQRRALEVAKTEFRSGIDAISIHTVLGNIRVACLDAIDALDGLHAFEDEDCFALYSFCNQVWQRLSVWVGADAVPHRHPGGPAPYIEI